MGRHTDRPGYEQARLSDLLALPMALGAKRDCVHLLRIGKVSQPFSGGTHLRLTCVLPFLVACDGSNQLTEKGTTEKDNTKRGEDDQDSSELKKEKRIELTIKFAVLELILNLEVVVEMHWCPRNGDGCRGTLTRVHGLVLDANERRYRILQSPEQFLDRSPRTCDRQQLDPML